MVQRTAAQRKQVREDDDLRTRTNAFANLERREEHISGVNFRLGGHWTDTHCEGGMRLDGGNIRDET